MTSNEPYDQGNDDWLLKRVDTYGVEIAKMDFTANECRRLLWLACIGKWHINQIGAEMLERRIRHLEDKSLNELRQSAQTKK